MICMVRWGFLPVACFVVDTLIGGIVLGHLVLPSGGLGMWGLWAGGPGLPWVLSLGVGPSNTGASCFVGVWTSLGFLALCA